MWLALLSMFSAYERHITLILSPQWMQFVYWWFSGCAEKIHVSDHRPVFATFEMGISSQFVAAAGMTARSGDNKIVFQDLCAEVKTLSKDIFIAEFHSACLDGKTNAYIVFVAVYELVGESQ